MTQKYSDLLLLETAEAEELKAVIGGRHGADDPATHDATDDKGGRRAGRGGRGGRGRGGADDPANHA